jgi:hypothetical protein
MLEHLRTKSPGKLGLDGGGFGSGLWMSLLMGLKAFEWLVKGWLVVLRLWVLGLGSVSTAFGDA